MDVSQPLAPSRPESIDVIVPRTVQDYLTRLGDEQAKFLSALADANRSLHPSQGHLLKLACLQVRLTQEFLDAQRSIIKRRAQTDATVAAIAADAAMAADSLVAEARARTTIVDDAPNYGVVYEATSVDRLILPTDSSVDVAPVSDATFAEVVGSETTDEFDHDVLVKLIDEAFESSEPDGVVARRNLRELLDGWWQAENQEATAAIDDANARAAMRVHLARVEVNELESFAEPTTGAEPVDTYRHRPTSALSNPLTAALDETDHEHLDDVLLHLLDGLAATAPVQVAPSTDSAPRKVAANDHPRLAPFHVSDSLNDASAAPQEAFDRFWGAFSTPGGRTWVFPQLLLPAVAVVGVLAVFLAAVG
jgi:hypothetical protein